MQASLVISISPVDGYPLWGECVDIKILKY
jgi:hypothetical protein